MQSTTVRIIMALALFIPTLAFAQDTSAPVVSGSSNGPSVDKNGSQVVDPTKNVLDLVQALEKRLQDNQSLTEKIQVERFEHRDNVIQLQADITNMHARYNADITKLRADYQLELDKKESQRIDAIRGVDQAAVKNEADRSQQAVQTLATAQAATAETLRSAVNTTATNIALQLDRTTSAITERIASLEKSSYTGLGRSTVADPQVEALRSQVEALVRLQAQGTGKDQGSAATWAVLATGAILLFGLIGAIATIVMTRHRTNL